MDPQINLDGSIFHKTCAKCDECKCQITLSNFTRSGSTLLCKTHYFKRFSETGSYLGAEKYSQKGSTENRSSSPGMVNVRKSPVPMEARRSPAPAERAERRSPIPNEAKDPVELPEGGKISLKDRMKAFSSTPSTSAAPPASTSPQNTTIKKPTKVFGAAAGARVLCAVCNKSVYPNDPQFTIDGVTYHNQCGKCADCNCQITLANFTKSGTTLLCKTHYFKRFSEEGSYLGGDKFAQKTSKNAASSANNDGGNNQEDEEEVVTKAPAGEDDASVTPTVSNDPVVVHVVHAPTQDPVVETVTVAVESIQVTVEETHIVTEDVVEEQAAEIKQPIEDIVEVVETADHTVAEETTDTATTTTATIAAGDDAGEESV
jgi:hypothetical protein